MSENRIRRRERIKRKREHFKEELRHNKQKPSTKKHIDEDDGERKYRRYHDLTEIGLDEKEIINE